MQFDAHVLHVLAAAFMAVFENDHQMFDPGPGGAQRIDENLDADAEILDVLDQRDMGIAFLHMTFDLRHAAKALRLLADVEHRLLQALCNKGGIGNAGGFTARDVIDVQRFQNVGRKIHQLSAHVGKGNRAAAIDIDGPAFSGRVGERLTRVDRYGFDIEQEFGGFYADRVFHRKSLCWKAIFPKSA